VTVEVGGGRLGHPRAQLGEMETGDAAIEHTTGVEDLAVSDEMQECGGHAIILRSIALHESREARGQQGLGQS
jgi:hypothetical protein